MRPTDLFVTKAFRVRGTVAEKGTALLRPEYLVFVPAEAGPFTGYAVKLMPVDGEKIEAALADGVLKVRIPKRPSAQPRTIAIKAS